MGGEWSPGGLIEELTDRSDPKQSGFPAHVSALQRFRHILRTRISQYPALYLPFARRKYPGPSPEVVSDEAEIVIDGYTRSACTFAVYAFQLAQDRPVRMAHHLHAPAQLIAAARMGIPALVVIRKPEGAILSQVIREPDVALRDALVAYRKFYSTLLPYRSSFVIGEFNQVTRDFGSVIRRVNERFGTSYAEFQHTDANMRECLELITWRPTLSNALLGFESGVVTRKELRVEEGNIARLPVPAISRDAWIPSADRDRSKDALRREWMREGLANLRSSATLAYENFLNGDGA
jgi:hypothetical protein